MDIYVRADKAKELYKGIESDTLLSLLVNYSGDKERALIERDDAQYERLQVRVMAMKEVLRERLKEAKA